MNRKTAFGVSLVLLTVFAAAELHAAGGKDELGAPTSDLVLIQGAWQVESVSQNGKPLKDGVGDLLVFAGDKLRFEPKDANEKPEDLEFELGGKNPPKQLDWKFDIDGHLVTIKSIFKIEGTKLTICHGEPDKPRPKAFDEKAAYIYQLKRVVRAGE